MPSEMIDRVAYAIMRVPETGTQRDYYAWAKAAVEAMREPTKHQLNVAEGVFSHFGGDYGDYNVNFTKEQAAELWPAMIDAALKE